MSTVHLRLLTAAGDLVCLLPDVIEGTAGEELNDTGALAFTYPRNGMNADQLAAATDGQVAVVVDGVELPVRLLLEDDADDDADESAPLAVSGRGTLALLERALVYPSGGAGTVPATQTYTAATPGTILADLVTKAQTRGGLAGVTRSFTTTHDSAGVAWASTITVAYDAGVTLLQVAQGLAGQGVVDVRMVGTELRAYNPDSATGLGRDKPDALLQLGRHMRALPRQRSRREIASHVLVVGDGGANAERANATTAATYGRREAPYSQGNTTDAGTMAVLGDAELTARAQPAHGRTADYDLAADGAPVPWTDYQVGDYIRADKVRQADGTLEPLRVRSVAVAFDADGMVAPSVELSDLFLEATVRLQRRMDGIVNGTVSPVPVAGDAPVDTLAPATPTGVAIASNAYLTADGQAHAQATISWAAVVTNSNGTVCDDLDHYLVAWRDLNAPGTGYTPAAEVSAGTTSVDVSPFPVGHHLQATVQAVDRSGNRSGWAYSVSTTLAADTTAPPQPSAPVLTPALGVVRVRWDGLGSAGEAMPADLAYVEVHAGAASGYAPSAATLRDQLRAAGTSPLVGDPYGAELYVRLVAVDRSGNRSAASAEVHAAPEQVDLGDLPDNLLTGAKLVAGAVGTLQLAADAVTEAKLATDAVTARVLGPAAVDTAAIAANAVTEATLATDAVSARVLAAASVDTGALVAGAVDAAALAAGAVTTAKLAAGAVDAAAIGANAVTTAKLATDAVDARVLAAGAVDAPAIAASAVTAGAIAANAVTAGTIAAGAVTTAALDAGAVTTAKLAAGAVTAATIAADTITGAQIAAGAIATGELAANAVTAAKIAADTITAAEIAANAITATELAAGAVTTAKLVAGAVTTTELAAGAVTAANIAAGTITATELAAGAITTAKIAAGAVTTTELAAGAVTAAKITAGTITATQIAAGTITATELAANAVTATKVLAGAIDVTKLAAGTLSAGNITTGTLAADVVLGARIKTANTGARVELNASGLEAYNAGGTRVVFIDASTGAGTFTGTLRTGASGARVELLSGDPTWGSRQILLWGALASMTTPARVLSEDTVLDMAGQDAGWLRLASGKRSDVPSTWDEAQLILAARGGATLKGAYDTSTGAYVSDVNIKGRAIHLDSATNNDIGVYGDAASSWFTYDHITLRSNSSGTLASLRGCNFVSGTSNQVLRELEHKRVNCTRSANAQADVTVTWDGAPTVRPYINANYDNTTMVSNDVVAPWSGDTTGCTLRVRDVDAVARTSTVTISIWAHV